MANAKWTDGWSVLELGSGTPPYTAKWIDGKSTILHTCGAIVVTSDCVAYFESLEKLIKDGVVPFELLSLTKLDGALPIEYRQVTISDGVIRFENLLSVLRDFSAIQIEALGGILLNRSLAFESLLQATKDAAAPYEWQGTLLVVTQDGVIPYESLAAQKNDLPTPLEFLSAIKRDGALSLDWDGVRITGVIVLTNIQMKQSSLTNIVMKQ